MKISMFHLMPHRELPADFEKRYHSVWVDPPWWELADAKRVGQYYNWTLDELIHAAEAGLDGICVNEHHQNAYGFMPGPNLMGSVLARATNGMDVGIVQMGATLPTTIPPIRVAEEYAMLDCISGGRMIAGMPLGSSMDVNLCYGIPPIEQRDRYYEAHDLIMKAWTTDEIFPWNGRYYQLPMVNLWPRPIQEPHPPVWVPGSGSRSTWDFATRNNHCYCYLSYFGSGIGKRIMDGFWEFVDSRNLDNNPYRAGFLQLVAVSESDAQAEKDYYEHIRYFYDKTQYIAPEFMMAPGHVDYRSMEYTFRRGFREQIGGVLSDMKNWSFKDFVDHRLVISGGPETVTDMLREAIEDLHCGNLMVLLHIGSMPHELTLKNIDIFAKEVQPHLQNMWDDDQWVNHWWPSGIRDKRKVTGAGT